MPKLTSKERRQARLASAKRKKTKTSTNTYSDWQGVNWVYSPPSIEEDYNAYR